MKGLAFQKYLTIDALQGIFGEFGEGVFELAKSFAFYIKNFRGSHP